MATSNNNRGRSSPQAVVAEDDHNGEVFMANTSESIAPLLSVIGESYEALQKQLEAAHVKIRQHEVTIESMRRRPAVAPAHYEATQQKLSQLEQDMASVGTI
jgi:predicted  nucleic acid-binding Zn-ribbon protein